MRNVWVGILGLVVAAGLAWYLLAGPGHEGGVVPGDEGASVSDEEAAPALRGSPETRPASAAAEEGRFRISGVVLDEDDAPVAGVPIELWRHVAQWPGRGYDAVLAANHVRVTSRVDALLAGVHARRTHTMDTVSGENGRFAFRLDDGHYHTVVARPAPPMAGGSATAYLVEETKTSEKVTLRVFAGTALRGRVEDAEGRPVGAEVRAVHGHTWSATAPSDAASGAFGLPAVPKAELTFSVTLPTGRRISGFSAAPPFDEEIVLRLPEGDARIVGSVQDPDGEGIPDAAVRLTLSRTEAERVELAVRADGEGRFAFGELPAGRITYAGASAEGFLAESLYDGQYGFAAIPLAEGGTASVEVTLRRGSAVHGRVTDKDTNAPIEGATITLYFLGWVPPQTKLATTDEEGRYRFEGVDKGRFMLLASHPGHFAPEIETALAQDWSSSGNRPPPHLAATFEKVDAVVERDLALAPGVRLAGVVLGPEGKPAAGARVFLKNHGLRAAASRWGMHFHGEEGPVAVSGRHGRFEIRGLAPRPDWVLFARKVGTAGIYTDAVSLMDGPRDDVVVRLAPGCVVRGRVLDEDGEPLGGRPIYVSGFSTLRGGDWKFTSAEDGSFELDSLPAAKLDVSVHDGERSVQVKVEGLSPGEVREGVELRFGGAVEVAGYVRTSGGDPVPGIYVTTRRTDGLHERREARTDEDGTFRIENVTPGPLRLVVTRDFRRDEVMSEPLEAPAEGVTLTYDPPQEVTVRGMVYGPDGKPLAQGRVTGSSSDRGESDARAVHEGRFELTIRGEPPYMVGITRPRGEDGTPLNIRSKYVSVTDPGEEVVIRLEEGVHVSGRVVDEKGKGLVGVAVAAPSERTKTDIEGRFRLMGLPPGPVGLVVTAPPGFIPPKPLVVGPDTDDVAIQLKKGVSVGGRARLPEGAKIAGGRVTAVWPGGRQQGALQPTGTFTVQGVPPETALRLEVEVYQLPDQVPRVAPARVDGIASGRTDVEILLGTGVAVEGKVLSPDGTPLAGVGVSLSGDGRGYAETREDGTFLVEGLRPGPYRLIVFRGGTPVTLPQQVVAPASGVVIRLSALGTISGRLVDPPPNERWVVHFVDPKTGEGAPQSEGHLRPNGSWTSGPLPEDRTWIVIARRDDGASDLYAQSEPERVGAKAVKLTLETGTSIRGRIVHEGRGVPQCWIRIQGPGWVSYGASDGEGAFTVRGLPPGVYRVTGGSWALGLTGSRDDVATGSSDVDIELRERR